MFEDKKSWRKILLPVCVLIIMIFGLGGWKFQSVDSYKEEQKKLQQEETTDVENKAEQGQKASPEKQGAAPSGMTGKTKLANGGELVTPTVPQGTAGAKDGAGPEDLKTEEAPSGTSGDASGADAAKDGKSGKNADTSGEKQDGSSSNKKKNTQASAGGNSSGSSGKAENDTTAENSGSAGNNDKTETAYQPERSPSPAKEPKEGMVIGTVTIDCTRLQNNMDALDANLRGFVPASGYIVRGQSFQLKEGANAYMALQAVCKELDIQLDASYTPFYNSYYIKGIGYLYEKNAGRKSGWLYSVNGEIPKVGVSSYTIREGDQITFMYTCNGGNDVR